MATPLDIKKFIEIGGNLYLISPYLNISESRRVLKFWKNQKLKNHAFIMSSGTTSGGKLKSYALSRDAIIANAKAVNKFLNIDKGDIWQLSLPLYHIGGLSIIVRSLLGENKVESGLQKWDANEFVDLLNLQKINFCSAVPTQLFDILKHELQAPKSLKGIFIGGDFLPDELVVNALKLNWPIIRTYGMTELCSQIASSFCKSGDNGFMETLPIHQLCKKGEENLISSPSLYTEEYVIDENGEWLVHSPDSNGFLLPDNILWKIIDEKVFLKPLGRRGDELKIKGKLFNLLEIKNLIYSSLYHTPWYNLVELGVREDNRDGKALFLMIHEKVFDQKIPVLNHVNSKLPKILFIEEAKSVKNFKRNFLGKLKKS